MQPKYWLSLLATLFIYQNSALALGSATPPPPASGPAAPKVYNETNQNIVVTRENSTFTITLKSNPTTGYSWFLREYDPNLLRPVSHRFHDADVKQVGAPGYEMFVFSVKPDSFIVPSQTLLRLSYARPFQGNDGAKQIVFYVSSVATPGPDARP